MKTLKYITLIAWFIVLFSCNEEESENLDSNSPVVEGYMTAGEFPRIRIYNQIAVGESETSGATIDGLMVMLEVNNTTYQLVQDELGIYTTEEVILSAGDSLILFFEYQGVQVKADTQVPSKPVGFTQSATSLEIPSFSGQPTGDLPEFPDPIDLNWTNTDGAYYVIITENIETDPEPVADFGDDEDRPDFVFRNEPTLNSNYSLESMQFQYFGTHEIRLFRILPDYAALYEDNSSSSQNLTSPLSDIENGLGIFTGINADTLYLEVSEQ